MHYRTDLQPGHRLHRLGRRPDDGRLLRLLARSRRCAPDRLQRHDEPAPRCSPVCDPAVGPATLHGKTLDTPGPVNPMRDPVGTRSGRTTRATGPGANLPQFDHGRRGSSRAPVRDRLDQPAVRIAEEQADGDLVIALLRLDSLGVEAAPDLGTLVLRNADGRVRPRPVWLVERECRRAEVGQYRVALLSARSVRPERARRNPPRPPDPRSQQRHGRSALACSAQSAERGA